MLKTKQYIHIYITQLIILRQKSVKDEAVYNIYITQLIILRQKSVKDEAVYTYLYNPADYTSPENC